MDRVTHVNGCWIIAGHRSPYVKIRVGDRTIGAHRFFYQEIVGPVPEGLELDHLCREPACVNPEHLEPVPHRTNTLRGLGPTALNAIKAKCAGGHEFTTDNTHLRSNGSRECRTCKKIRMRLAYRARINAA